MKKEPMVLESNQNNALVSQNGICFMLPAAMGMGGGHIPMIVVDDDEDDADRETIFRVARGRGVRDLTE